MKKIFYGVLGEGLGHASRTQAFIEKFQKDFEIHLFTSKDALKFFQKINYPHLHEIKSVSFSYNSNGSISYLKSSWKLYKFLRDSYESFEYIRKLNKELNPSLFITDFEPIVPRIAHQEGIPLISIDNQHRFTDCSLKNLPLKYRFYSFFIGQFVNHLVPLDYFDPKIISTFHYDIEQAKDNNVRLTNVFIRENIVKQHVFNEGFLLCYLKSEIGKNIFNRIEPLLIKLKVPTKVYCDFENPKRTNISFHEFDYTNFVKDLASCKCVCSTAGNQLIGECRYLGKPILAIPIPSQFEQLINGFYVNYCKLGISCNVNEISEDTMINFLNYYCLPYRYNGLDIINDIIYS
jgi:uncharacterized protein (TIGR00661 family)